MKIVTVQFQASWSICNCNSGIYHCSEQQKWWEKYDLLK